VGPIGATYSKIRRASRRVGSKYTDQKVGVTQFWVERGEIVEAGGQ